MTARDDKPSLSVRLNKLAERLMHSTEFGADAHLAIEAAIVLGLEATPSARAEPSVAVIEALIATQDKLSDRELAEAICLLYPLSHERMPGNGTTPTTPRGSAETSGKAGTEARHASPPSTESSDTPRTDTQQFSVPLAGGNHTVVFAEDARQLERELASAKRDADHFYQLSGKYLEQLSATVMARDVWQRQYEEADNERLRLAASSTAKPIDMLMFCPRCNEQHIDRANEAQGWTNPPHATHTCQKCGLLWRPSNVNTNGIDALPVLEDKHTYRIQASYPATHVNTLSATGESVEQLRHRVIQAAYRPSPMCRDCADRDGTCHDGTKCDPFEAALDVLRASSGNDRRASVSTTSKEKS